MRPRTALSFAVLPLLLAMAPGQETVVRTYDVHDLLLPAPEYLLIPVGPALPGPDTSDGHLRSGGVLARQPARCPRLDADQLSKWLQELWGADSSAFAELRGDVLALRASPGIHAKVQDLLSVLHAVMGRTVGLRLHVLAGGRDLPAASILDAEAIARLLSAHQIVRTHELDLRSDVPGSLENGRAVHMLRDYDVEVAERASISDPKADIVFLGDRLAATATPMADGRFWLRWGLTSSHADLPFRQRELAGRGLGNLDLPEVDLLELRGTAALAPGQGLLLGGDGEAFVLVLEEPTPPPLRTGSVAAVPLGPLAVAPLLPVRPTELVRRPGSEIEWDPSPPSLPDVYQVLAMHLDTDLSEQLELSVLGTHAILGSPGLGQRLEKLAQEQAAAATGYVLEFAAGSLANATGADRLRPAAEALAARMSRHARAATLPGQAFALEHWVEHAFVRDYDVEIAKRAEAVNPVVDTARSGWSVRGQVHRSADGRPALSGRFQWADLASIAARDTGIGVIGSIDYPEIAFTEVDLRAALVPGSWQVLHQAPDPQAPDERTVFLLVRAVRGE